LSAASPPPEEDVCALCARPAEEGLLSAGELGPAVRDLVEENAQGTVGLCGECAARAASLGEELERQRRLFVPGAWRILPTPLRVGAPAELTGRGVTIAFLDAGFYAHPDLVEPRNRIVRYFDLMNPRARHGDLDVPDASSWHGLMTSSVACGNGQLSGGFYRGLASEADLVLVKVGSAQRIVHDDIRRGLDWVIRHRHRYGIRIVNVSCGGDYEASYLDDALSHAVERATRAGLLVVAAAGNVAGKGVILPPASAPSALTVGGLDDKNRLAFRDYDMYHSSFGPTPDGLQKPEVIAPALFVAAPILPGTETARHVRELVRLAETPDRDLPARLRASEVDLGRDSAVDDPERARAAVRAALREQNVINADYKHVDGSSFAAPIVSSAAAQLLQLAPGLTPQQLKLALIRSACRLPHVPVDRQGWGVVDVARALRSAGE
jgi:serine protease AprX